MDWFELDEWETAEWEAMMASPDDRWPIEVVQTLVDAEYVRRALRVHVWADDD